MLAREKFRLFGYTRALEAKFDEFLDCIGQGTMVLERGIAVYLESGPEAFDSSLESVRAFESKADALRRDIETELYERTLIPDLRSDVMHVLEDTDSMLNVCQSCCYRVSIEQPDIPAEFHPGYLSLIATSVECADAAILAARAFLREPRAVRDHTHKVVFLETESDKLTTSLMRKVFDSELPLERKIHLRYFAERLDALANASEDAAQRLRIFALKRSI